MPITIHTLTSKGRLLDQFVALQHELDPDEAISGRELLSWQKLYPDRNLMLLATVDERPVGFASADWRTWDPDLTAPDACMAVHPTALGEGVGTALYRELSEWSRNLDGVPTEIRIGTNSDEASAIDYWTKRGFGEVERLRYVYLDLDTVDTPQPHFPAGLTVTNLDADPQLITGVYALMEEVRLDIPGEGEQGIPPYEEWRSQLLDVPLFRPESNFVVVEDDSGRVVGWGGLDRSEANMTSAWHGMTATARAWRQQGLAKGLKATTIAWGKEQGIKRLLAVNEARNAPMRGINKELGYSFLHDRVVLRGPLMADEGDAS
jgi:GNAT superfamily N-acetyltransferase